MLHTYFVYPALLHLLSKNKTNENNIRYRSGDDLPEIAVICAAYNEEAVIAEKIESTFNTTYPKEKIIFYIGTDACSDKTIEIIKSYQEKVPLVKLVEFKERTGKINIINKLCSLAQEPVLVMTDANVYFQPNTFFELIKNFKDIDVKMVCGNISKRALNTGIITKNELQYFNFENFLKSAESKLWNIVIGAEGGCYALRKENYIDIPSNFTVDDFFITCNILRNKGKILFQGSAIVSEDVKADTEGEFRRKARIATGNFQNLFYFKNLLNPFSKTGFAYLSHKVFRWITPFLFILNGLSSTFLINYSFLFKWIFAAEIFLLLFPLFNALFIKLGMRIKLLSSITHFVIMNFALVVGFIRYCQGVKSSVWQPVKR